MVSLHVTPSVIHVALVSSSKTVVWLTIVRCFCTYEGPQFQWHTACISTWRFLRLILRTQMYLAKCSHNSAMWQNKYYIYFLKYSESNINIGMRYILIMIRLLFRIMYILILVDNENKWNENRILLSCYYALVMNERMNFIYFGHHIQINAQIYKWV